MKRWPKTLRFYRDQFGNLHSAEGTSLPARTYQLVPLKPKKRKAKR